MREIFPEFFSILHFAGVLLYTLRNKNFWEKSLKGGFMVKSVSRISGKFWGKSIFKYMNLQEIIFKLT